ncbi:hypothetical protein [Streptomyces sp. NRRL S-87]|uniref:hypothetical protein n=1 Tax=Streptomyces sp. NRRL S-87 TaxID=1463920 RepID=UPI00068B19EB|nr:hypothetical protein [Streptomyces sp. NRRL S-87]
METAITGVGLLGLLGTALVIGRRPGVVTGKDGRISTSLTLAFAWTVVLVWMLLVLLAYAVATGKGLAYFTPPDGKAGPLAALSPTYLELLGGPFAALVLAKAVVGGRLKSGTMTKMPNPGAARFREAVSSDSGRTDLMDLQYVLFNGVAMLYVVVLFAMDVAPGLPKLPGEIWVLTAAPAGAYLANKTTPRPNPVVTNVSYQEPGGDAAGEPGLVIEGGAFPEHTRVTIGDAAPVEARLEGGRLFVPAPRVAAPTTVTVTTPTGLRSEPFAYRP